ncbi:MAG: type II toxin-antitoxin system VapC family toxin [Alphaproteobacteria bacterium]|nr:type II toxin-antitoxin system VapC family toxin [Alphaproteobacteria bacterium]
MILLDTNVLSELMRPKPEAAVLHWLAQQSAQSVFTTSITEAEILFGLALLPQGVRRDALTKASQALFAEDFADRVLSFDRAAAQEFADIAAARRQAGRPIAHADAQIAAIARSHKAILATRNLSDFEQCRIEVVDPWAAP